MDQGGALSDDSLSELTLPVIELGESESEPIPLLTTLKAKEKELVKNGRKKKVRFEENKTQESGRLV